MCPAHSWVPRPCMAQPGRPSINTPGLHVSWYTSPDRALSMPAQQPVLQLRPSKPGKAQSSPTPCWAHGPCPWGHGPETTTGPQSPQRVLVGPWRRGSGLRAHPLSQTPEDFNSKVQSIFAPSQIKGCSAREMSWLIKDQGALESWPTTQAAHTLRP